MSPGKRHDEMTPDEIEAERKRMRLVNRAQWVRKWWPRIRDDVSNERTTDNDGK